MMTVQIRPEPPNTNGITTGSIRLEARISPFQGEDVGASPACSTTFDIRIEGHF